MPAILFLFPVWKWGFFKTRLPQVLAIMLSLGVLFFRWKWRHRMRPSWRSLRWPWQQRSLGNLSANCVESSTRNWLWMKVKASIVLGVWTWFRTPCLWTWSVIQTMLWPAGIVRMDRLWNVSFVAWSLSPLRGSKDGTVPVIPVLLWCRNPRLPLQL